MKGLRKLNDFLLTQNWSFIYKSDLCVHRRFEMFIGVVTDAINIIFPMKSKVAYSDK